MPTTDRTNTLSPVFAMANGKKFCGDGCRCAAARAAWDKLPPPPGETTTLPDADKFKDWTGAGNPTTKEKP